MKFLIKSLLFLLFNFLSVIMFAQSGVEMADELRSSGKIFVVVAVLSIIFIGIIVFLFLTERKISKLERKISEKK